MYPYLGIGCGHPRTGCQQAIPLVYDESLSVTQQIACLWGYLKRLDDLFVRYDEFADSQNEQTEFLINEIKTRMHSLRREIKDLIKNLELSMNALDPTWGTRRNVDIVFERVYDFDRYFSFRCSDYDSMAMTAEQIDSKGYAARQFDTVGGLMLWRVKGGLDG